jgi:hypothetical protein
MIITSMVLTIFGGLIFAGKIVSLMDTRLSKRT